MDEPHTQGGGADKSGMRSTPTALIACFVEMLIGWEQEGDRFVRLPEVYVKGNNVRPSDQIQIGKDGRN